MKLKLKLKLRKEVVMIVVQGEVGRDWLQVQGGTLNLAHSSDLRPGEATMTTPRIRTRKTREKEKGKTYVQS
jgi:hypothetical protein